VPKLRLLIADDQPLMRAGFRAVLEATGEMEVVAETGDGLETVSAARTTRPDVILMDIRMPQLDGIEAIRRLPHHRVLVLTTFGLDEYIVEALRAGASGFITKDVPAAELVRAVRVVAAGEALLTPAVTRQLLDRVARRLPAPVAQTPASLAELTDREREVLELLARGMSNAEIAEALTVGDATVKTHVSNVLMKLGLRDRVQAVVLAYEVGLVRPGNPGESPPP
jgi:DNA-binding NarL/FixJ family response regulator